MWTSPINQPKKSIQIIKLPSESNLGQFYAETWKNKDETKNKEQKYDEDMIRETKRWEVEQEIRKQVDHLMREELDLLKIVSDCASMMEGTAAIFFYC